MRCFLFLNMNIGTLNPKYILWLQCLLACISHISRNVIDISDEQTLHVFSLTGYKFEKAEFPPRIIRESRRQSGNRLTAVLKITFPGIEETNKYRGNYNTCVYRWEYIGECRVVCTLPYQYLGRGRKIFMNLRPVRLT